MKNFQTSYRPRQTAFDGLSGIINYRTEFSHDAQISFLSKEGFGVGNKIILYTFLTFLMV